MVGYPPPFFAVASLYQRTLSDAVTNRLRIIHSDSDSDPHAAPQQGSDASLVYDASKCVYSLDVHRTMFFIFFLKITDFMPSDRSK